jgi:hypothetical protein
MNGERRKVVMMPKHHALRRMDGGGTSPLIFT